MSRSGGCWQAIRRGTIFSSWLQGLGAPELRALEFQPEELAYALAVEPTDLANQEVIQERPPLYDAKMKWLLGELR